MSQVITSPDVVVVFNDGGKMDQMLVNLAAAQLANERADDAIATLGRLAALGAHSPVEKSAEFTRKDASTIEFMVPLKPDEERSVTYRVRYEWK